MGGLAIGHKTLGAVKGLWMTWCFYGPAVLCAEELSDEVNAVALMVINTVLREFTFFNVSLSNTTALCSSTGNSWVRSSSVKRLQSPEIRVSRFVFWKQRCNNNLKRGCHLLPLPLPSWYVKNGEEKSTGAGAVGTGTALCAVLWCDSQLETPLNFSQLLIVQRLLIWIKLNCAIDKETPECL